VLAFEWRTIREIKITHRELRQQLNKDNVQARKGLKRNSGT
jgi:hypothetical protein